MVAARAEAARLEVEVEVEAAAAVMATKRASRQNCSTRIVSPRNNITSRCTILLLSVVCFSLLISAPILAHLIQTGSAAQAESSGDSWHEQGAAAASLALNYELAGSRAARQASATAGEAATADADADDATTAIIDFDQRTLNTAAQQASGGSVGSGSAASTVAAVATATAATPARVAADQAPSATAKAPTEPKEESGANLRAAQSQAAGPAVDGTRAERAATAAPSSPLMSASMAKAKASVDKMMSSMSPEFNATKAYLALFEKKPYSQYWSIEKKWEDVFERFMALQESMKDMIAKKFQKDAQKYADMEISSKCVADLNFVQNITSKGTNVKWLFHMFDAAGKGTAGLLTGNMADLGHVVQCLRVRAPARGSMEVFNERFYDEQTRVLGERFRGKYCLVSLRPVLPEKPRLVSRFTKLMDDSLISNLSFVGEPAANLKRRLHSMEVPAAYHKNFDRKHIRLDQIPFESELYEMLKQQRNFMYNMPRYMGVCYPSSCTKDDIKFSIQKTVDDKHMVAEIEFDCEQEEDSATSEWFSAQRVIAYCLFWTFVFTSFAASVARNILVDKMALKRRAKPGSAISNVIGVLDMMSMDKCAGILFVKTHRASPIVNPDRLENNRSTAIDALKGALMLLLVYALVIHQGCLGLTFMWSRWTDSMFPFFRAYATQIYLNVSIWAEAFYVIGAYLIGLKFLENSRPSVDQTKQRPVPDFFAFTIKRYIRLFVPMFAFMLMSYIWPRLSNGFVMQDRANKMMSPCDEYGWINFLMFHNYYAANETCLWPTHVSASFFQLHLLSYPILTLFLFALRTQVNSFGTRKLIHLLLTSAGLAISGLLALFGLLYPALQAERNELIVPFLVDYLDYDNYQRVLDWMVLPTYNHLTSYMAGLVLAYLVVRDRLSKEIDRANNDWSDHSSTEAGLNLCREGSIESVVSSSSTNQELGYKPAFRSVSKHLSAASGPMAGRTTTTTMTPSSASESSLRGGGAGDSSVGLIRWASQSACSIALCLLILASITVSWLWTGLGNPMSFSQNFWFVLGTKLVFTLAFSYLFYIHFATRRNSPNPWLITRFLVPIGRMSLMVFYVSWLVIWFDLLSSLYQWHPSHFFAIEKFNEIIFMTLVISLFAYGAFEGSIKKLQYLNRAAELKRRPIKVNPAHPEETADFEHLFLPLESDNNNDEDDGGQAGSGSGRQTAAAATTVPTVPTVQAPVDTAEHAGKTFNNRMLSKSSQKQQQQQQQGSCIGNPLSVVVVGSGCGDGESANRNLSVIEQYKLNAELRANNSFASVRLFESAGATGDLPLQVNDDPRTTMGDNN